MLKIQEIDSLLSIINTNCKMEEESGKNVQSITYRLYCNACYDNFEIM